MKLPTLLCVVTLNTVLVLVTSVKIPDIPPNCEGVDGVAVRGVFHENKVLAQGLNRPYQLSYHKRKHEIFFSNNVGNDTEDKFEILRLFPNETLETIKDVENGFATAINEEKQVAYFGGSSGIYKMNLEDGKVSKIIHNHDVWDMFFKKHLYFITYPSQQLFKVKHTKSTTKKGDKEKDHHEGEQHEAEHQEWIQEKIYQFVIDGDNDIFITNKTGLFIIKNGTEHRIHVHGEETVFRAIEINHKGEAIFVGRNGLYAVKKLEHTLHEIAHIKNIFGLTIDDSSGMFVYSNPLKIIKLIPSMCKIVDNLASEIVSEAINQNVKPGKL